MTILATRAALIATALGLGPLPAAAATATPLGQFGSWTAAAFGEGEARSCYILATPASAEPASLRHGEVYFFVKEAETPQATESSLQAGYDFEDGSEVTVTIGEESFRMITKGSHAWLRRCAPAASWRWRPAPPAAMRRAMNSRSPASLLQRGISPTASETPPGGRFAPPGPVSGLEGHRAPRNRVNRHLYAPQHR